jgi:CheY-like chemotaxis protein
VTDPSIPPCVLVVADSDRIAELVDALSELHGVDVLVSSGGDDTLELFEARRPVVVVLTASLELGDAKSLIGTLRGLVPRAEVAIIVIGDDVGPIRTALDALDLAPDRFVTRPLSSKALRFAVTGGIDAVRLVRGAPPPPRPALPVAIGTAPGGIELPRIAVHAIRRTPNSSITAVMPLPMTAAAAGGTAPDAPAAAAKRAAMRARWEALADSIADGADDGEPDASDEPTVAAPPSDRASRTTVPVDPAELARLAKRASKVTETSGPDGSAAEPAAHTGPVVERAGGAAAAVEAAEAEAAEPEAQGSTAGLAERGAQGSTAGPAERGAQGSTAGPAELEMRSHGAGSAEHGAQGDKAGPAELEMRSAAGLSERRPAAGPVAPSDSGEGVDVRASVVERSRPGSEPEPAPLPPLVIKPRRRLTDPAIEVAPSTADAPPAASAPGTGDSFDRTEVLDTPPPPDALAPPREPTLILRESEPAVPVESRTRTGDGRVVVAARTSSHDFWSEPMPIAALSDRDPAAEPAPEIDSRVTPPRDVVDFDDLDTGTRDPSRNHLPAVAVIDDLPDVQLDPPPDAPAPGASRDAPEPRDFARELRAKMSMMAHRLFHGGGAAAVPSDHAPRHDHHTEIDLAAFSGDQALGGMGSELEPSASQRHEIREIATSPGSWDTQVRERGLPDTGALVRGVSDAAMLLARMFAQSATGRVAFRRDEVETIVYFDRGRPVFASSNEPRDRMGELLLREGKITASQYERCQTVVAESGRRMGEILVDFGYLKRRELLPAVRRHVEDIVYSLFAWERGSYAIALDAAPCAERIRLSRQAASLILEGIRRKLDRTTLERLIGSTSTVIEVRDRERLGGIVHMGDLAVEERAALAAFDGQADLAHVARTAGVDIADVLPLAWGLCALGLAIARRTDAELPDESAALVGETDLAIDRARVRARWQLVTDADYFALLGVRRDATGFEIRRAYQSARRDFAADCFPTDRRRELARELDDIAHVLDEAFRVLRDDRLRQTYLANLVD